jgi:predicted dehydrogenase
MGREFASAAARWLHLTQMNAKPVITAVCNRTASKMDWFRENIPTVTQATTDYRRLLANDEVEAVYVAVPHNQHMEIYCRTIESGKHLLGEKPFGIDLDACIAVLETMKANPQVLVRCASQYIYYPGVQRILDMVQRSEFGQIIELESGFSHSSDLDPDKPLNWKRISEINGDYGCMGDLGFHVALAAARAGWKPERVSAVCTNIVSKRPDANGDIRPCDTIDNAAVLSQLLDPQTNESFPWTLRVHRIMPGEKNTWYLNINGTKASARFSLKNPKNFQILRYSGGGQAWQNIDMGFDMPYKTITGPIFEPGACDVFMQMMAAFMYELENGKPLSFAAACPSPQEMLYCHRLFTAVLASERNRTSEKINQ